MLPQGFQWQPYVDGPALYVDGEAVAICCPIPRGSLRVDFVLHRRSEFFDDEEAAKRYVEAWANRWTDRIRHEAGTRPVPGWGVTRKP